MNSEDLDQIVWMCSMIWNFTVCMFLEDVGLSLWWASFVLLTFEKDFKHVLVYVVVL